MASALRGTPPRLLEPRWPGRRVVQAFTRGSRRTVPVRLLRHAISAANRLGRAAVGFDPGARAGGRPQFWVSLPNVEGQRSEPAVARRALADPRAACCCLQVGITRLSMLHHTGVDRMELGLLWRMRSDCRGRLSGPRRRAIRCFWRSPTTEGEGADRGASAPSLGLPHWAAIGSLPVIYACGASNARRCWRPEAVLKIVGIGHIAR